MKNFTLTILFLSLLSITSWGQCTASFTSSTTNNGSITIVNTSTHGAYFDCDSLPQLTFSFLPSGASISFNAQNSGNYYICALVVDSTQTPICSDQYCDSINVNIIPCTTPLDASFYVQPLTTLPSITYHFSIIDSTNVTNYSWDFGNGSTGSTQEEIVNYSQPGTYTVCLSISDSSGVCQDASCQTIVIPPTPCNINSSFNVAVSPITQPLTYDFTIIDTSNIASYSWSFGDGNSSNLINPIHTYNQSGTYTICLIATSISGCIDTTCITVPVNNTPCNLIASFTSSVDSNGIVTLTNTGSDAYFDIPALGLLAPIFISSGTNTSLNLQITGNYLVCAYAYDSTNVPICSEQYCDSVNFTPTSSPCNITANYNWFQVYDSLNGNFENTVYLINYSTPGSSFNYSWDFGDGTTSNLMYPSHLYANVGTYTVCLTISDNNGCNSTYCDSIYIQTKASGFSLNVISQNAVGIEETQTTQFGEIYPNPTSENSFITINSVNNSEVTVRVIDISGKIISQKINTLISGEKTIQLDTQNLTNGMYFISITDEKGTNTNLRLIKK